MAEKHEAVWWILGGILVLGLARQSQVAQVNAAAAGSAPAAAGGFFGGLLQSLGIGGAAASSLPATGLQPINYQPISYGSPGVYSSPYQQPVTAIPTPAGGFNNLNSNYGAGASPGVGQYLIAPASILNA